MQHATSPSRAEQAQQACASCKMRKRKCTKELPKCSLCSKKNWKCDYSQSEQDTKDASALWPYISTIEDCRRNMQYIDSSTMLFLDSRMLQHGQVEISHATIPIPAHIVHLVGDIAHVRNFASHYFNTIHVWMPIISKKRFYDHHLHPLSQPLADLALLFLCMKLITQLPPEPLRNPQTLTYFTAKQFYLEVETAGIFSIYVLQAGVLISLYELGHAIYPSAFLSIGACARYAYALGINGNATSQIGKAYTLVELEERRRVWWAIVILDRFVSISCHGRRFAIEDPKPYDLLPVDDAAWDQGTIVSNDSFALCSPTSGHMSKFALVCQAARLLGQVLKHISSDIVDQKLYDEEGMQLDRTLHALISASETMKSPECDQIAICYSALMVLHETSLSSRHGCSIDSDRYNYARTVIEAVSKRTAITSPQYLPGLVLDSEGISPWGSHLVYLSCVTYIRLSLETENLDSLEALKLLKQTLSTLDKRWKAAGAYLQLLEAREVMRIA